MSLNKKSLVVEVEGCWLVDGFLGEGDQNQADVEEWLAKNPNFQSWDRDWFEKEFVNTDLFIADDSDNFCSRSGSRMIFETETAAREYGRRDAAIESGVRKIIPALYVSPRSFLPDDPCDGILDDLPETLSDVSMEDGCLGVFDQGGLVVFSNDAQGRKCINILEEKLRALCEKHKDG